MSDREKLLAVVVGSLLAFFMVFGVFRSVQSGMRTRNNKIFNLQKKIQQEEEIKLQALADANLVREFKIRSLDVDPEKAHLDFSHWLEKQVEEIGLYPKMVRYNGVRQSTDDYKELTYLVTGEGNIKQITDLLYRIQATDTLHRVERFSLRQGNKASQLKLEMNVAALSMGDVDAPKVDVGVISKSKLGKSLEEYHEAIVVRNVFAPANNAPKFASLGTQTVELGKQLDFAMNATDADGHELSYRLLDSPDDSAKLKGRNLLWKPSKVGEYKFQVEVQDDGLPAKNDVATVRVKVVPESKPKPKEAFDEATVTKLSGFVQGPNEVGPRIWLNVQSDGENLSLGAGDEINVGNWRGIVKSVYPQRNLVVLESEDGSAYELKLGGTLADAKPVKSDEKL